MIHINNIIKFSEKSASNISEIENRLPLSDKIDYLGILSGKIAHDLNNLLGGLYGYIELAMEQCDPKDKIARYLGKANATYENVKELSLQLMAFAKSRTSLQRAGDLASLLRKSAKLALLNSNVACSFRIARDLPPCDFDEKQIGQVIANLIKNACQAMPDGGTIKISAKNVSARVYPLSEKSNRRFIKISFSDAGTGIPPEVLPKIFDPFFTTKKKCLGLGLSTVYSVINNHGGKIVVKSPPEKGSVFHVFLPASE